MHLLGPPQITSSTKQSGVVGENVHINCAAITVPQPEADGIIWMYHESKISEGRYTKVWTLTISVLLANMPRL